MTILKTIIWKHGKLKNETIIELIDARSEGQGIIVFVTEIDQELT